MPNTAYVRGSASGTGRNLAYQSWANTIEVPAYEKMTMIPSLDEVGRPYGTQNIRYWDTLTASTVASTAGTGASLDIVNLATSAGTPTVLTYSSTFVYVCVGYNDDTQDAIEIGLDSGIRENAEACVADACDGVITALVSNLTAGYGDAGTPGNIDDIRKLAWQLRIASAAVDPGNTTIHACLHPGAGFGLTGTQEWHMSAEVRGDAENPVVRGVFQKSAGVLFRFTTKMPTANGNGGEGALYVPEAFAVGWNQHPKAEKQRSGATTYHLITANLGGRVKWDSRARFYRTVAAL